MHFKCIDHSTLASCQFYGLLSNVNFSNRGVTPIVFESRSKLSHQYLQG